MLILTIKSGGILARSSLAEVRNLKGTDIFSVFGSGLPYP